MQRKLGPADGRGSSSLVLISPELVGGCRGPESDALEKGLASVKDARD